MNGSRKLFEWIAFMGCAFILSKAVLSYVLDPEETATQGNPAWRMILAISYIGLVLVLIPWYRETLFVLRRNWSLLAMVLLALLSSLWANMPDLVLRKSIGLYGATLLGVSLAVRVSFLDQLRMMSWLFRATGVLSLAGVLLFPSLTVTEEGQWMGVFSYKNALGSVLGLSLLVEWQRRAETPVSKVLKVLAVMLYLVLLTHSDSVTPTLVLIGTVLLIEMYKFGRFRIGLPKYAIFVAISIVVALGFTLLATNSDSVMGAVGRSSNLTGRTEIWALVLSFIPQRPILGYGYDGFWLGASPESAVVDHIMRWAVTYSHNGFLEQLLNLGVVGLAITLTFLGIGMKRTLDFSERRHALTAVWPLAFLVYFILYNTVECTILAQDIGWALCVACVAGTDPLLLRLKIREE